MLSDHGQIQGATFKQRNGLGLAHLEVHVLEGDDGRVAGAHGFDQRFPHRQAGERLRGEGVEVAPDADRDVVT